MTTSKTWSGFGKVILEQNVLRGRSVAQPDSAFWGPKPPEDVYHLQKEPTQLIPSKMCAGVLMFLYLISLCFTVPQHHVLMELMHAAAAQ